MTLTEPKTTSPAPENLAAAEKMLAPGGASESPVPERSSLLERAVRSRLKRIVSGSLTIETPSGSERFGKPARPAAADVVVSAGGSLERANPDAHGTVVVHDERFWTALALRGSVGAGEAYAYGWWTSPEPTDVVRVLVANHTALEGMEKGLARLSLPMLKAFHWLRDNSRSGSKKNISAHYDLSNDFFGLFLDPTMTYSSAYFDRRDASLEAAQVAKIDRLCERLNLGPSDHLLEIGTGWGGFARRAALKFGCQVTTTTISKEQHAFAVKRISEAGLDDQVEVLLRDYRDLKGQYSKIVSVEMIEAVGARHYGTFFETCARLLEPGGALAMQAITIHDAHFERARKAVDFIQRHIFPGSCIPSVTALSQAASRSSDLRPVHMEDIGTHYVPTLRIWRDTLRGRREEALAMGFDEDFLRLFDFYFCYCEGGFAERHISVAHLTYARAGRSFSPPVAATLASRG
jgi:cyclopropane-fatty-acyl-phospholipid synthase